MSVKPAIVIQDQSEMPMQVPHELDDADLTPAQFRIYAHLVRRSAKQGRAWPGVDSMAKVSRISRRGVIDAIKALEDRGMVAVRRREGERNVYILTRRSSWDIYTMFTDRSSICTGAKSGTGGVQNQERKSVQSKGDKQRAASRRGLLTDDEFWDALEKNPAYAHINFERERGKMAAWLLTPKGRGRQLTRQFVVNWLNRIDTPLNAGNKTASPESSRNVGTANQGKSSQYAGVGKVC